jgi:hypothetical protein
MSPEQNLWLMSVKKNAQSKTSNQGAGAASQECCSPLDDKGNLKPDFVRADNDKLVILGAADRQLSWSQALLNNAAGFVNSVMGEPQQASTPSHTVAQPVAVEAARAKPPTNSQGQPYYLVVVHGDSDMSRFGYPVIKCCGKKFPVSIKNLADLIKKNNTENRPVRLDECYAGNGNAAIDLANAYGQPISAPTDLGGFEAGGLQKGSFEDFYPGQMPRWLEHMR